MMAPTAGSLHCYPAAHKLPTCYYSLPTLTSRNVSFSDNVGLVPGQLMGGAGLPLATSGPSSFHWNGMKGIGSSLLVLSTERHSGRYRLPVKYVIAERGCKKGNRTRRSARMRRSRMTDRARISRLRHRAVCLGSLSCGRQNQGQLDQ